MEAFIQQSGHIIGWIVAVLFIIVGFAGAILPAIPGIPLVLVGLIIIAWMDGFVIVGPWVLVGLGLLTILSILIDFIATAEGARRFGAGRAAILGATIGLIVGIFFGPFGILLGPFAGAAIGHYLGKANIEDSMRAGVGASIGVLVGTMAKVVIGVIMVLWFALVWWF
ncbi:MAG: DUF456 family protein [Pseudomonadota bacterium]